VARLRGEDRNANPASLRASDGGSLLNYERIGDSKGVAMRSLRYAHLSPSHRRTAIERLVSRATGSE